MHLADVFSSDDCRKHGRDCDDGDEDDLSDVHSCTGCKENNITCVRTEKAERDKWLQNSRDEILQQFENPPHIPQEVLRVVRASLIHFRRAWKQGRSPEIEQSFQKANAQIAAISGDGKRFSLPSRYVIPYATIIECFDVIRLRVIGVLADPGNTQKQATGARDIAAVLLQMGPALITCGLRFRDVANPWIQQVIEDVLNQQMPKMDQDLRELFAAFIRREMRADTFQEEILGKAEPAINELFGQGLSTRNQTTTQQALAKIGTINTQLEAKNSENQLHPQDHIIPLEQLMKTCSDFWTSEDRAQTVLLDDLRSFLVAFFAAGCSSKLGDRMKEVIAPDEINEVSGDFASTLGKYKTLWRAAIHIDGDDEPTEPNVAQGQTKQPGQAQTSASSSRPDVEMDDASPSPQQPSSRQGKASSYGKSSAAHTERPSFAEGVPGPSSLPIGVTRFGKLEYIKSLRGFTSGFRAIVNVGTETTVIHECIPGSAFGRGMGQQLLENFGQQHDSVPFNERRAAHVDRIVSFSEVQPSAGATKRAPIGYFLIRYSNDPNKNPHAGQLNEVWTTKSDTTKLMGKKSMQGPCGYETQLRAQKARKMDWLKICQERSLHPDTGKPITAAEKEQMPWIFAIGESSTGGQNTNGTDQGPANVGVGDDWTGPPT